MKKLLTAMLAIALAATFSVAHADSPRGTTVIVDTIRLGSDAGAVTLRKLSNLESNSTGWIEVPYGVDYTVSFEIDSAGGDSAFAAADSIQIREYVKCSHEKLTSDAGAAEHYIEWTRFDNDFQSVFVCDTSTKALFIPTAQVDVEYAFKHVVNLDQYVNVLDTSTAYKGAVIDDGRNYTRLREVPYCNSILFKVWPLTATDSTWAIGCVADVIVTVRYNEDDRED